VSERVGFYYRYKDFIDGCMEELESKGFHEVDAEEICYDLAYELSQRGLVRPR